MRGCARNNGGNCVARVGEVCCSRAPGRIAMLNGWSPQKWTPTKLPVVGSAAESVQFELPNGGFRDAIHLVLDEAGVRA